MKVFIAYGYNDRDRWIESTVPPLIEAFGSEPVDGRELAGALLSEGIRSKIRSCQALIAFFTRRDGPLPDGSWTTHEWVKQELTVALENNKQVLQVFEQGVKRFECFAGAREYIDYREDNRAECIVEVVKVLGLWHSRMTRRFQLLPIEKIKPHLSKPYFECRYRVMEGSDELPEREVKVQKIQGGLFIDVPDLSRESLIQVEIVTDAAEVSSDYTSVDAVSIKLDLE